LNVTATSPASALQRSGLTLALCFAAAIIEGIDLQSMGIAASGIAFRISSVEGSLGLGAHGQSARAVWRVPHWCAISPLRPGPYLLSDHHKGHRDGRIRGREQAGLGNGAVSCRTTVGCGSHSDAGVAKPPAIDRSSRDCGAVTDVSATVG